MIKHLFVLMAMLPALSGAERLVHPVRADLGGRTFLGQSMPETDYTNCVAWYDAAAGDYNAGTTNYFLPDLSTNHNAANPPWNAISSQPTRVYTNGAWAFKFDGVDDKVFGPSVDVAMLNNTLDLSATFVWTGGDGGNSYGVKLIAGYGRDPWAGASSGCFICIYNTSLQGYVYTDSGTTSIAYGTISPGTLYAAQVTYDGMTMTFVVNGVVAGSTVISSPLKNSNSPEIRLGANSSGSYRFDGYLYRVILGQKND